MERPTKIHVVKKHDGYDITCVDEMSGSAIGIDLPINGYKALAEHFRTGVMEISSDDIAALPIFGVGGSFDDEIDAELERRSIVQYNDDYDDEPHWDEGKLHWARKMFREGAKWANEAQHKVTGVR